MGRRGEQAIVVGASMGGLAAAAALAAHYDRVTIIERDELPCRPEHRRGVPQSKHAHGLQPGGLQALEQLLPGLTGELAAGSAVVADVLSGAGWYVGGGWFSRAEDAGVAGIGLTRPFLEQHVRTLVAALPGVSIRDRTTVNGPLRGLRADNRTCVAGVEVAPREGGPTERLGADLVVDACGRGSRLPEWLTELGHTPPPEEQVHCRMSYLTRRWQLTSDVLGTDVITVITPAQTPHFGVVIAQEDGSHIVTLGGLLDSAPAKDEAAYLEFARNLPDDRIARALEGAVPITDFQSSHFPYSRRRRYDRLRDFPDGVLALGDSIASFNPMYGQGMTVAALEAIALRDQLARGPLDARRFFKAAHRIEDVAWKISTGGDLRFPDVEGKRTPDMKIMNGYLDRLTLAARTDPQLGRQFLRVAGFIDPPQSFFKPAVVRRVLKGSRAARRAGATADVETAVPVRAAR
jgi:2-polyprenyl-6-methoxyphenol hydroxylase-like FAD-dependent oxidoreductase